MLLLEEGKERKVRKENLKKRTLFFIIKEDSRVVKYWLLLYLTLMNKVYCRVDYYVSVQSSYTIN